MSRNAKCTKVVDLDAGTVTFNFADGGTPIVVHLDDVEKSLSHLALHGVSHKVGDSYAGAETVAEARQAAIKTIEMLVAGEWTIRTPGAPKIGLLADAIARMRGVPVEGVLEVLAKTDDETKKGLRANPKIKALMSQIKAERDAEKAEKAETDDEPDLSAFE